MEEAAGWLAALDAGSVTPQAFEQWRAADPRHAIAFAQ
ncbi:FecR/PupR family sigma factor regulator, partial [Sphingobium sp. ba1]